jgi:hypothetical protein
LDLWHFVYIYLNFLPSHKLISIGEIGVRRIRTHRSSDRSRRRIDRRNSIQSISINFLKCFL